MPFMIYPANLNPDCYRGFGDIVCYFAIDQFDIHDVMVGNFFMNGLIIFSCIDETMYVRCAQIGWSPL